MIRATKETEEEMRFTIESYQSFLGEEGRNSMEKQQHALHQIHCLEETVKTQEEEKKRFLSHKKELELSNKELSESLKSNLSQNESLMTKIKIIEQEEGIPISEVNRLKFDLDQALLKTQNKDKEIQELTIVIENLKLIAQELEEKNEKIPELEAQLTSKSKEIANLHDTLSAKAKEITQIQEEAHEKAENSSELKALRLKTKNLEEENETLVAQRNVLTKKKDSIKLFYEKLLKEANQTIEKHSSSLKTHKAEETHLHTENTKLQSSNTTLQSQLSSLQAENASILSESKTQMRISNTKSLSLKMSLSNSILLPYRNRLLKLIDYMNPTNACLIKIFNLSSLNCMLIISLKMHLIRSIEINKTIPSLLLEKKCV